MSLFYRSVTRRFALSGHHKQILRCGCEAHSRMTQAQAVIAKEGLTVTDRHGQQRPHPAVQIELASRTAFLRALRELGLSDEADSEANRPPRLTGRYQGRR